MEVLKAENKNLNKVINLLLKGGVIVCPTDTVYGLIADVNNEKAVDKVFKIKERPFEKPLPVFVKDLKTAKYLAVFTKEQKEVLKGVWPGKVTAILKAKTIDLPQGIVSGDKKIGLRIPNYELLNNLLEKINRPLAQTSANISGRPSTTKIKKILEYFKENKVKPDLVLDGGNLKESLSSTVIDLTNYRILRKGEVSKKEILPEKDI